MEYMKQWPYLQDNNIISLIAPASSAPQDTFLKCLEFASQELNPSFHKNFNKPDLYFAQKKDFQVKDIISTLSDESPVMWSLRGGYGSMRLIPELMQIKKPKIPKCFIGFSDNTALHLFLNQKWNWPTLHGINFSGILGHQKEYQELLKILRGELKEKTFKLKALNNSAKKENTLSGVITGGNFRIVQSSLGTPWEIKTKGKILFLEDVGERAYSIDRMFEQLIQAKVINNDTKAIVLGNFVEGLEKDGRDLTPLTIKRWAQELKVPMFEGLPCGHGTPNFTLPFNTPTVIESGRLTTQFNK